MTGDCPVGLMLVGNHFEDDTPFRIGNIFGSG